MVLELNNDTPYMFNGVTSFTFGPDHKYDLKSSSNTSSGLLNSTNGAEVIMTTPTGTLLIL